MALASAQVIDAIAAVLRTLPGYSAKVFTSRAHVFAEDALPAWRVLGAAEEVTPAGVSWPQRQQHELEVEVAGYAKATANLDDTLHAMAALALGVLFETRAQTLLAPLNVAMQLSRIEREMEAQGQAVLGRITLLLRVKFLTFNNAPETIV